MSGYAGMLSALGVFAACYVFIVIDRIPGAVVAMLGAFTVVLLGLLTQEDAVRSVDFNTIGLLCGMMMIVQVLRKTGLFEYVAIRAIKLTRGRPARLLVAFSVTTGVLSAFLDNVTTVLIVAPMIFALSDTIRIDAGPFLIGIILFANIGGTATLIGDPPNLLIGAAGHLDFLQFLEHNGPIVVVVAVVTSAMLHWFYGRRMSVPPNAEEILLQFDEGRALADRGLLWRSLLVFGLSILGFVTHGVHGLDPSAIALGCAFLLLWLARQSPQEILGEVEWPTLFFFVGLFVMVGALEKTGVMQLVAGGLLRVGGGKIEVLTAATAVVSSLAAGFLSAVPYTIAMISVIKSLSASAALASQPLWWALSLGACFGANATLFGAAANLIVAGLAQRNQRPLPFWEFARVGLPVSVVSTLLAVAYLHLRHF